MKIRDLVRFAEKNQELFSPVLNFRDSCRERILTLKRCNEIKFRLEHIEEISLHKIRDSGISSGCSFLSNLLKCNNTSYSYDFHPYKNERVLRIKDMIIKIRPLREKKEEHANPLLCRVKRSGECYSAVKLHRKKQRKRSGRSKLLSLSSNDKIVDIIPLSPFSPDSPRDFTQSDIVRVKRINTSQIHPYSIKSTQSGSDYRKFSTSSNNLSIDISLPNEIILPNDILNPNKSDENINKSISDESVKSKFQVIRTNQIAIQSYQRSTN